MGRTSSAIAAVTRFGLRFDTADTSPGRRHLAWPARVRNIKRTPVVTAVGYRPKRPFLLLAQEKIGACVWLTHNVQARQPAVFYSQLTQIQIAR